MGEYIYKLDVQFSIYHEMSAQLLQAGWTQCKAESTRYHLLLGDRFSIDYALLGEKRKQLVNYFPKSHLITLKSATLRRIRENYPDLPGWLPQSFILMKQQTTSPQGKQDTSLPPWKRAPSKPSRDIAEAVADRAAFLETPPAKWIVKPSSGCGGEGITLAASHDEVIRAVEDAPGDRGVFVVQAYVDRPFLLKGGRKFDIRAWVLVTAPFKIYLFSEGSLRTSSSRYVHDDFSEVNAHITNHCLQEKSDGYGKFEEGNEMWYSEFDAYLKEMGDARTVRTDLVPQFISIIKGTLETVSDTISPPPSARYAPFQLFGYDFLLDEGFKVWLLEVNGSPASAERFKSDLVADMLRKAVHQDFPINGLSDEAPEGTPRFEEI